MAANGCGPSGCKPFVCKCQASRACARWRLSARLLVAEAVVKARIQTSKNPKVEHVADEVEKQNPHKPAYVDHQVTGSPAEA